MLHKSKGLLAACLIAAFFAGGCAGTEVKPETKPYADINYVCPKCQNKMKRVPGQPQGFMSKCPKCGEKFLTF